MIHDWNDYIDKNIFQPIDSALNGMNPGCTFDMWRRHLEGKIWFVKDKNNKGELLTQVLKPLLEENAFEPQNRMTKKYISDESDPKYWNSKAAFFLDRCLNGSYNTLPLFEGKNIIWIIEKWVENTNDGYHSFHFNMKLLIKTLKAGLQLDWKTVKPSVEKELKEFPSDVDHVKVEYYCLLGAIIKINCFEFLTDEKRNEWYEKLLENWHILTPIYSVLVGRIINSKFKNFSQVIGQFRYDKKEYASLMVAALRHHPEVLQTKHTQRIAEEVENVMRENHQKTDLHDLCKCIFESNVWGEYDLKKTRMTTAEMVDRIKSLENAIDRKNEEARLIEQRKLEAIAESMREQLGRSISMVDLEAAILQSPPAMANMIFTQLDLRLEDVCEVWTKHRKELKKKVLALEMAGSKIISDTFEKVSAIEKKPREVKYIYETGAKHMDYSRNLMIASDVVPEALQLDK